MNTNHLKIIAFALQATFSAASFGAPEPAPVPVAKEVLTADPSYVLRPNDTISLSIYLEPDLSKTATILKTGQATFELIGSTELSGLSVADATEKIRKLYLKYLVDPRVNLSVSGYATEYVSVLGAVKRQGDVGIPVSGKLDLAGAMASVGGLSEDADRNSIQLTRLSGSVSRFKMDDVETGSAGRTPLYSGDRIIVNKSRYIGMSIRVLGAVGKPGPVQFPLDGELDLVRAIAYAGGLTDMANPKKVMINRNGKDMEVNFKELSSQGNRVFPIYPKDVIEVKERFW